MEVDKVEIIVGKNAKDNWNILEDACEDDIWFHVKDESSAYVIIINDFKNEITQNHMVKAALLCKEHSKLKNKNKVAINWLPVKDVKKGKVVREAKKKKKPNTLIV